MEGLPQAKKESLEHIPTLEEVRSIFRRLTEKRFKEVRKINDEKGLYLFDITVPGKLKGEVTEYSYRRGQTDKHANPIDSIQVTFYEYDRPVSGTTVAEIVDGEWKIL